MFTLALLFLAQTNVRVTGTVPSGMMTVERVNVGGSLTLVAKPRIFNSVLDVTLRSNTGTLNGTSYKITFSTGVSELWTIPAAPLSTTRTTITGGTSGCGTGGGGTTAAFVSEPLNGVANGTNSIFTLTFTPLVEPLIFRNGVKQTVGVDYSRSCQTITFLVGAIPQTEDILNSWYSR